ncbi:MAG: hypothetical protein OXC11_03540 [Rhodospirillales bacterium]|nr:hypothetical protein [Rhodospirillales bacterium]
MLTSLKILAACVLAAAILTGCGSRQQGFKLSHCGPSPMDTAIVSFQPGDEGYDVTMAELDAYEACLVHGIRLNHCGPSPVEKAIEYWTPEDGYPEELAEEIRAHTACMRGE